MGLLKGDMFLISPEGCIQSFCSLLLYSQFKSKVVPFRKGLMYNIKQLNMGGDGKRNY